MDEDLLFYIVVIGIGLISQLFGKKKKNLPESPDGGENNKEITFEDLLREFQSKKEGTDQPVVQEAQAKKAYEKPEMNFSDSRYPDDDEIDEVYQQSIRQAQRNTNDPDIHPEFGHFKEYDEPVKEENVALKDIQEALQDKDSLAKSLILGEILNRKY